MTHSDMERPLEREGRELMRQLLQGHLDQCTHALRASGDRDEYWHYHEAKEHDRNHTAKYASGDVPPLTPSKPTRPDASPTATRRLRIVK